MKIIEIKDSKDGSADITYELSKTETLLLQCQAKEEGVRFTKAFCNKKILRAIEIFACTSKEKR